MATNISALRLNLLRAGYLLLVVGLGSTVLPQLIELEATASLQRSVVLSLLCALSLLSIVGLRYPLQMLPLLFFEILWKAIWLLRVALPLALTHRLDTAATETAMECLIAVIFPFLIPWDFVLAAYVRRTTDAFRSASPPSA